MRVTLRMQPLLIIKALALSLTLIVSIFSTQLATAEVINIPVQRTVATQPITALEIIAIVKTLLNGRVLSIIKKSSYSNPDCHHVKVLEDKGEFQLLRLGCYTETVVQINQE